MRSWLASILLFMVSAPLLAQTAAKPQTATTATTTTTTTTTTAKPKAKKPAATAKKPMAAKPTTAGEIKTLRDAVNAQQQQIQMLRDELARRDAAVQQVQQQVNSLQSATQQAQSAAQAAETCCKTNEDALAALRTNVGTVQTTATATANSLQADEKRISALESPMSIKYKGITITPGGFIAEQINYRQKNQNLDNFGNFGAIPFDGSSAAYLSEFRDTARYSRLSLLAQGKWGGTSMQSYYEVDFEGAAQTANEVQTNSWQPRIREAWLNVDAPHGISVVGGQTWSLLTANRTGVGPRGLMLPSHISASLIVGFHYTRQAGLRLYKTWDLANNKKVYFAFAAENPEYTTVGAVPANLVIWGRQNAPVISAGAGTNCAQDRTVAGLAPCSTFAAGLAVDVAPDFIGKVAIEPGWGHFELAGILRFFRDRVALATTTGVPNAGSNKTQPGAGISFNGVLPVVSKKVDIVFTTLAGRGIGRYGTTGGPDTTILANGGLVGIMGYVGDVGVETHVTPKFDFNVYVGGEYFQRSPYYTGGTALLPTGFGYGLVSANLTGCTVEIPAAGQACAASNKTVIQASPGFWYTFYRGPAGRIAFGTYYSYFRRYVWTGALNATGTLKGAPIAQQHEILTSIRWYFP